MLGTYTAKCAQNVAYVSAFHRIPAQCPQGSCEGVVTQFCYGLGTVPDVLVGTAGKVDRVTVIGTRFVYFNALATQV